MSTDRRRFLQMSALAAGALPLGGVTAAPARARSTHGTAGEKLKILILGGTHLSGPPMVEYARARGHEVTLFNRGKTNPGLFPDVETLIGDRKDDLKALEGRRWDVVVDNSASIPSWVTATAELLSDADLYLYTSSISAYAEADRPGLGEDAELAEVSDEETASVTEVSQITGENYGGLKARCERAALEVFGDRALIIRPGLIVGPGDRSHRFTYWPVRIERGGEILAPGDPSDPVQIIDGADLGEWKIRMIEDGATGVYNATGPESKLSIAEMLYGIRAITTGPVDFTWVPADFLAEHEVQPWSDMPVWLPPKGEQGGIGRVDVSKAVAAGLTFRPLADTARRTLDDWIEQNRDGAVEPRAGIDPEREQQVLAAWHASRAG